VGVALEATLGVAVRGLVAGQVPDDESLVARSGQEHVGAAAMLAERLVARRLAGPRCSSQLRRRADALLKRGSEGGNPARVALEGATENQLLGHDCGFGLNLESTSAVVSVRSSCAHCGISSCGRRPCFGDGNTCIRALAASFTRRPTWTPPAALSTTMHLCPRQRFFRLVQLMLGFTLHGPTPARHYTTQPVTHPPSMPLHQPRTIASWQPFLATKAARPPTATPNLQAVVINQRGNLR
jgi:hypothetical protein